MQESVLGVIDEYRGADMHGVYKTDALLDATPFHQSRDGVGDVNKSTPILDFKPEILCKRLHPFDMPEQLRCGNSTNGAKPAISEFPFLIGDPVRKGGSTASPKGSLK